LVLRQFKDKLFNLSKSPYFSKRLSFGATFLNSWRKASQNNTLFTNYRNIMKTLSINQYLKSKTLALATILFSYFAMMPISQANLLLNVDLSVENTISISTTDGNALITESAGLVTGLYLEGFFGDIFSSSISDSLITTNITSANNTSGLFNNLFHFGNDPGLNLFSFDGGSASFSAGEQAFVGEGRWTVSATAYQSALNGALSGNLFFPADSINDIATLSILGTWAVSGVDIAEVPAPSVILLLALGLAGVVFSNTQKRK
jgi:hypothetical protein